MSMKFESLEAYAASLAPQQEELKKQVSAGAAEARERRAAAEAELLEEKETGLSFEEALRVSEKEAARKKFIEAVRAASKLFVWKDEQLKQVQIASANAGNAIRQATKKDFEAFMARNPLADSTVVADLLKKQMEEKKAASKANFAKKAAEVHTTFKKRLSKAFFAVSNAAKGFSEKELWELSKKSEPAEKQVILKVFFPEDFGNEKKEERRAKERTVEERKLKKGLVTEDEQKMWLTTTPGGSTASLAEVARVNK